MAVAQQPRALDRSDLAEREERFFTWLAAMTLKQALADLEDAGACVAAAAWLLRPDGWSASLWSAWLPVRPELLRRAVRQRTRGVLAGERRWSTNKKFCGPPPSLRTRTALCAVLRRHGVGAEIG